MAEHHSTVLDNTINNMIDTSDAVTRSVETRVAQLIESGDTSRTSIIGAFQTAADNLSAESNSLRAVSASTVELHTELGISGGIEPEDVNVENLLVQDASGTIRENIMNHAEKVTGLVVAGVVTGVATEQLVRQARGSISGLMMATSDPTTTRLQTRLATMARDPNKDPEEYRQLRKTIADRLGSIATAGSLSDTLRGVAESVVMRFDGAFTGNRANRLNIEKFAYEGSVIENTRPWCAGLAGQEMDRETIEDLWTDSWAGKSGSNPWVDRGGYNCRHYWVPVSDE